MANPPDFKKVLVRGFQKRCPQCGEGKIFQKWCEPLERCSKCQLVYEGSAGDTWAFTYIGSAGVTGLFLAFCFFIRFPHNYFESGIYLLIVLGVLLGTAERRKGVAIAIDYLARRRLGKV